MFIIKNLKKINGEWTRLECDFEVIDFKSPFQESKMWIAVNRENADMLSEEVYDPFVLVPLVLGMYYGQDVHIDGNISPRLYHNINHYLLNIFENFSRQTKQINFTVKGTAKMSGGVGGIIGTGVSCGIDSLTTIYDNFIKTSDPDFKINALFLFNCGTHGNFENKESRNRWIERSKLNQKAAQAMGLPMYIIDSNFHAFTHKWGEQQMGYLAIYSCCLGIQKKVKRYLTAGCLSYDQIAERYKLSKDFDMAEYCESYMPHLISTERFELVIDGCQYTRPEKTVHISDWYIAQKHLNVCLNPISEGRNCSCCSKCERTLMDLESAGQIDKFSDIFDLKIWEKNKFKYKCNIVHIYKNEAFSKDNVDFARKMGIPMPNIIIATIVVYYFKLCRFIKRIFL